MICAEAVAREAAAWVWYPADATVVEAADHLLVRWPAWHGAPPTLLRAVPPTDVGSTVEQAVWIERTLHAALTRARAWDADELACPVPLGAPEGYEEALVAHGGRLSETVDVLALDLAGGVPDLDEPAQATTRWCTDAESVLAATAVAREAFGEGPVLTEEQARHQASEARADLDAGRGGLVLALHDGEPAGSGGVTLHGTTARLWGGAVAPAQRGRGVYRALLGARLRYGVERGATMALVKGRVATSGPILRRAGFEPYGQERTYRLPVTHQASHRSRDIHPRAT